MQVITQNALEMLNQINLATENLVIVVNELADRMADLKLGAIQPALFNECEAAIYTGIAVSTLRRYRMEGQVGNRTPAPGYVKVGKSVFYPKAELDRWIREDLPWFGGRRRIKAAAA